VILIVERGKVSDLSKAVIIRGTCQDMCPEKERYQRESRHQVALYEYQVDVSKVSKKLIQVTRFFALF
jgi:hypothetical protein